MLRMGISGLACGGSTPAGMAAFLLDHAADPLIPEWETIGEPGPFPEEFESIPDGARDLMRTHLLKALQSQDQCPA